MDNQMNPSPNAPNLWMARVYPGSVMLEGTTLSEGRGTTRPLEVLGAPDIDAVQVLREWVDNPAATPADLDQLLEADESTWRDERESVLLYRE